MSQVELYQGEYRNVVLTVRDHQTKALLPMTGAETVAVYCKKAKTDPAVVFTKAGADIDMTNAAAESKVGFLLAEADTAALEPATYILELHVIPSGQGPLKAQFKMTVLQAVKPTSA